VGQGINGDGVGQIVLPNWDRSHGSQWSEFVTHIDPSILYSHSIGAFVFGRAMYSKAWSLLSKSLSVRLPVRHSRERRLSASRYQHKLHAIRQGDVFIYSFIYLFI